MTKQQGKIVSTTISVGSAGNITVYKPDLSERQITAQSIEAVSEVVNLVYSSLTDFLFDSVFAAQEVAYALRAEWDECTGVKIPDLELEAFRAAISLANTQWCYVGDSEPILRTEPLNDWTQEVLAELNRLRITIPVSRAEVYWAISDWKGCQSAESISQGLSFSKSTVQGHLSALEKAGAIRGEGRPKQYSIAQDCPQKYFSELQSLADIARTTRCYWRSQAIA